MEVHHHSHTARKKWTHYFWEFLMLFLAVFCGFLAEYYLEHTIEHNREKQFIGSLFKDIEADIDQLSKIRSYRLDRMDKIDSVNKHLTGNSKNSISTQSLSYIEGLKGHFSFYQTSGTLDQLKNAGGLRLIRNRKVVDSIQSYDQQIRRMYLRDNYEAEEMRYTVRLAYKLINGIDLATLYSDTTYFYNYSLRPGTSATVALHKEYLGEYLNSLNTFRFVVFSNMVLQDNIKQKAENLLATIKKTYRL